MKKIYHSILSSPPTTGLGIALFIAASLMFTSVSATPVRNGGSISGSVQDEVGEALPFATVILYAASDSSLAKAGYTDEGGRFLLSPLEAGSYFFTVTYTSLKAFRSEVLTLEADQNLEVPEVIMVVAESEMEAVVIQAEKPLVTVKPDMTVFNVANSPTAIGTNAFDLMNKAPGVMVDNNDNIILLGKAGTRVLINGKPSPLSGADLAAFLKSIPSGDIEAIEIITNPSAKYDAEGNAGIINIRMKKDQRMGANASLTGGYSYSRNSRYNGGITANYRNKRFNAFGSYQGNAGKYWSFVDLNRVQGTKEISQESDEISEYRSHSFRGGMDYQIDKKQTLGFMINGNLGKNDKQNRSDGKIFNLLENQIDSLLISENIADEARKNFNFNLNYRLNNGDKGTWTADLDYGTFNLRRDFWQPNTYLDSTRQETLTTRNNRSMTPTDISIYTAKADHERNLWGGKLGAGVKFAWVTTDNTFNFYNVKDELEVLDSTQSNHFSYQENVNAAYISFAKSVKKFQLMGGLRAEQTNSLGELTAFTGDKRTPRSYINLFPSAGATWKANQKNSLSLNYSRRIDRPRYQDLNPFEFKLDELTFNRGNPFLSPQISNNVQISHSYMYSLNTTLAYSYTSNYFTDILDTTGVNQAFQTKENLGNRQVLSLSSSYPRQLTRWWSTFTQVGANYAQNSATFEDGQVIDASRLAWNVYHQSTFQLPKNLSFQLSGFYRSPALWGASFLMKAMNGVDAGVTWKFLEGRGSLQMSVSDIFWGNRFNGTQELDGLSFTAKGGGESRQLKVNFTWLIGNEKVKGEKRKSGLEDEKGRL